MRLRPCLRAALRYLEEWAWCSIALCPPDHFGVGSAHRRTCRSPGKRPLGLWDHWQRRLPTKADLLAQWEQAPTANVGVVLGAVSGLMGIDVDGREGDALLQPLSGGDLPATLASSPREGIASSTACRKACRPPAGTTGARRARLASSARGR
jgi:hypothetical protein